MVLCKKRETPHPRDGLYAWCVCLACLLMNALLFGTVLSFGVLLPVFCNHFQSDRGPIAWIGSLAMGFTFFCCPLVNKIVVRFGERPVGIISGIFAAASLLISSLIQNIVTLYFSYGVLLGFSGSCLFTSLMLINKRYFHKKLALATAIITSGSSIGLLAIGPLLQALIESLGWRGALRVMSGIMLCSSFLSLLFDPNVEAEGEEVREDIETQEKPKKKCSDFIDCSVWRNPRYTVGTISILLIYFGLYVPMIHVVRFAEDLDISGSKASLLFTVIGVCSFILRILIGIVLEKKWLTALQCLQLSSLGIGISLIVFTQATSYHHFIIFAIFYGSFNGIFVANTGVFFTTCFPDIRKTSVSLSTGFMLSSVAIFTGPPLAGFVADKMNSYIPAFYIFGGLVVFSGALPFCLLCRRKSKQIYVMNVTHEGDTQTSNV